MGRGEDGSWKWVYVVSVCMFRYTEITESVLRDGMAHIFKLANGMPSYVSFSLRFLAGAGWVGGCVCAAL